MSKSFSPGIRIPHVVIFLSGIIFIAAVATYFIPSGSHQRIIKQIDG